MVRAAGPPGETCDKRQTMIPRRGHVWESKGGDYLSFPFSNISKYRKRALAGILSRRAHRRLYPLTTGPHAHRMRFCSIQLRLQFTGATKSFFPAECFAGVFAVRAIGVAAYEERQHRNRRQISPMSRARAMRSLFPSRKLPASTIGSFPKASSRNQERACRI